MDTIPEDRKSIIKTKDGPICGLLKKYGDNKRYYKYQKIPYAKPPLGKLRFLPPVPYGTWTELKDCTQPSPSPLTFDNENKIFGSEDCLYIEVSTPALKSDKPLPVMFWISCYGFIISLDSINIYESRILLEQDVIFVRCGFRLGAFGFLSVQDFSAPGNSGLKDIVLALKWVQRNISAFGGDPNNVTILGHSAGGVIVHFMMLSPMATGLFHKAVIQSATALNSWSIDKNPTQSMLELANTLGIKKETNLEIIEELRSLPAEDIMKATLLIRTLFIVSDDKNFFIPKFRPCIEMEFEGQSFFLTKNPLSTLKKGNYNKVPLLIGCNNNEGILLEYCTNHFYEDYERINNDVSLLVPKSLAGETEKVKEIGQQLLSFYFGDELTKYTKWQYVQLISDYYFLYYVNKTVRLHKKYEPEAPIYYYILNYAGDWRVPSEWEFFNSMGHIAELPFLFELKLPDIPIVKGSKDSLRTRSRVVKMWTNFAKYGNPTPEEDDPLLQIKWDPVDSEHNLNYLSIGLELTKGVNPFQERMNFWDVLHREYMFSRTLVYFSDLGVEW